VLAFLASIRRNRRLISDLVRRDLRARYIGSTMGFFWSVIFPIINLFVYMFVFRFVLKTRWSDHQGTSEVALLMLAGILVWQGFAESTSRITNALVENANLIQKVVFPSEVLPVYLTISSLVNMSIGVVVAIAGVSWFAYVRPDPPSGAGPPVPVAFGEHVPGSVSEAPPLASNGSFRCATSAEGARYTAATVIDTADPAWRQPFAAWKPGAFVNAGWADTVYAATGEWARAVGKEGYALQIDHWRDRSGRATGPPRDGVPAVVVGAPERAIGLGISLVSLPALILLQSVFMLGIGSFLSAFNLFVKDTYHVIGVLLTGWMFGTPIFYPERLVRDAGYGWLPDANPMGWLIECYREVLVYGAWPDPALLLRFGAAGVVTLVLGALFFMRQKPRFPDLL
jgi:ABC-type polysaccharide/polyol phosphate export permease